jgi:hypothetical protein
MTKIGRNSPCPCGSGKKYKRCCEQREAEMRKAKPPSNRTRFEPGSYGDTGGFLPSLLCYKETDPDSWEEYYCLVKPDVCFEDEDSATAMATSHLDEAFAEIQAGGNPADVAISLRHHGYKQLDQFQVIRDESE